MLPKMTPAMEAAAAKVLEGERLDGLERLILISPDDKPVWEGIGDENSVDAQAASDLGLMVPGSTVIHNHPTNISLSLEDVISSGYNQVDVYAVCLDGCKFYASAPKLNGITEGNWKMLHMFQDVTRMIYTMAVGEEWKNDVSIRRISEHVRNVVMSSNGNYTYRYSLSPEMHDAATRAKALLKGTPLAAFDYT